MRIRFPVSSVSAVQALLLAGLTGLTIWLYFGFPHSVVDDAYIYARYAQNLARYGQLTWNVGADPVEGYTGVLMPLIYAVTFLPGLDFEISATIIGLSCFWATGAILVLSSHDESISTITILFYCLTPFLYRHAFSGMETICFACLLVLAYALKGQGFRPVSPTLFSLSLLLLALIRPEGLLFALAFASGVVLAMRNLRRATFLVCFILPYSGYFLWRWAYYGYPLPNPYYVKATEGWSAGSIEQIGDFFLRNSFTPALTGLAALGLALWILGRARRPGASPPPGVWRQAVVVFIPLTVILIQYARSTLSMNYSHRFLAPYYPLLLLLAGNWLEQGFANLSNRPGLKTRLAGLTIFLCGLGLAVSFPSAYRSAWQEASLSRLLIQSEHIQLGKKLQQAIPPNETLVVLKDAGAIPYYSGLPTIDLGGLNDEYLTHKHPANTEILTYLFQSRPGVFVITSYSPDAPNRSLMGGDQRLLDQLLSDERFADYSLVEILYPPVKGMQYYEFVYLRNDLAGRYHSQQPFPAEGGTGGPVREKHFKLAGSGRKCLAVRFGQVALPAGSYLFLLFSPPYQPHSPGACCL